MKKIILKVLKRYNSICLSIKKGIVEILNGNRLEICTANIPFDFCHKMVEGKGKIRIGDDFHIRKWSYIRVRSGAKLHIGKNCSFNNRVSIVCHDEITIGDNVLIGENVAIYDHNHIYNRTDIVANNGFVTGKIKIGNNVWIGSNVIILPGSIIGDNCVIGAGTLVNKEIPSNSIIYDKREKIIRKIDN